MRVQVNAIAFREADLWVVQGIEYDICARAKDLDSVETAFTRALIANMSVNQHLGREGLEGVPEAPSRFRELYERAKMEVRPVHASPDGPVTAGAIRLAPAEAA